MNMINLYTHTENEWVGCMQIKCFSEMNGGVLNY